MIKLEPFTRDYIKVDKIVLSIDFNTSAIPLLRIIGSTLEMHKRYYILFYHHFLCFLNCKTNFVTNLNPLKSVSKSFCLFLIADSVFVICI